MMEVERANPSKKRREEEKGMRTREMGKRGWTTNEREEKLGVWNIRTTYFRSFFACFFLERGGGLMNSYSHIVLPTVWELICRLGDAGSYVRGAVRTMRKKKQIKTKSYYDIRTAAVTAREIRLRSPKCDKPGGQYFQRIRWTNRYHSLFVPAGRKMRSLALQNMLRSSVFATHKGKARGGKPWHPTSISGTRRGRCFLFDFWVASAPLILFQYGVCFADVFCQRGADWATPGLAARFWCPFHDRVQALVLCLYSSQVTLLRCFGDTGLILVVSRNSVRRHHGG